MNITHLLFSFDGRIRRLHYWLAAIALSVVMWIIMMVGVAVTVGGAAATANAANPNPAGMAAAMSGVFVVYAIVLLVFLWPMLALQVKRWHDRDKGWLWVFISFIPVVGPIWALVELGFLDGTQGPNRFGPSPKGIEGPAAPVVATPPAAPTVAS
jgi:uncharacterized membrane protein YhaH (DUF805 family)